MLKVYCENCNVLLNNEDDIFGSNLGQLYHSTCMHINHGKSADCQPMLFRMHLKFADTPTLTTEAEEGECGIMELKNSNNAAAAIQKLEAKIKTLKDALLVKDRYVNKLIDSVEKLANTLSITVVDKAADIVNNTSQDKSHKQAYGEGNLNGEAEVSLLQTKSDGNKLIEAFESLFDNQHNENNMPPNFGQGTSKKRIKKINNK